MFTKQEGAYDLASTLYDTYSDFYVEYTKEQNKNIHIDKFDLDNPVQSLIKTFISDILTSQTCYKGTSPNFPFFVPTQIQIVGNTETYYFNGDLQPLWEKLGVEFASLGHIKDQNSK